jgi:phosphoserine phosphatase
MSEGSERAKEGAKEVAERLFALMPDFDYFDLTMHRLESIIENMDEETAKEVLAHYDLTELARQCRHYADVLSYIARTIDELLGE